MNPKDPLEAEFNRDLHSILERERELGRNSVHFGQMLERFGGLETAHRLLAPDRQLPPKTFGRLREYGRPDLTFEHYVCMEKYKPLFSEDERSTAAFRLKYGE